MVNLSYYLLEIFVQNSNIVLRGRSSIDLKLHHSQQIYPKNILE